MTTGRGFVPLLAGVVLLGVQSASQAAEAVVEAVNASEYATVATVASAHLSVEMSTRSVWIFVGVTLAVILHQRRRRAR